MALLCGPDDGSVQGDARAETGEKPMPELTDLTGAHLAGADLPADDIGLLEGLVSTRAIRRYHDEPVPPAVLRAILFAATRAPSGSNRQPFRFLVLTDGPKARAAKSLIAASAREVWGTKRQTDRYDTGSGAVDNSPKARMARTMQGYVDDFDRAPALVLPCLVRYRPPTPFEGASIYPACQNLLLAARARGYGGVLTGFHFAVDAELHALLEIPDEVFIAATITLGRPVGGHGPVRRRPLPELVYEESWGQPAPWALDPPGTAHTAAGPAASGASQPGSGQPGSGQPGSGQPSSGQAVSGQVAR
jgi:nitroreductase